MYIDYHIHTDYSDDSVYPMEAVVKDAIELGLEEICFTDHVDYGVKVDWDSGIIPRFVEGKPLYNVDYPKYFRELDYLREKYGDRIRIRRGLEFGMQMHTIGEYLKIIETYPMDFVLLSIHEIDDLEFWTGEFQKNKSIDECYEIYYDTMYQLVSEFKDYSVLAHMDLMRRYTVPEDYFVKTKEAIIKVLQVVIEDGKGIEVNTSHVRYGVDGLTPSIEILKLYHELGGTVITIGSDAHKKEHLGFMIEESKEILREIGFEYFCTFENMEAIYHLL